MTDKLYLITDAQRDLLLANHLLLKHETDLLQSLPMVDSEPVAWTWDTMGSGGLSGYRMAHFQMNKPEKTATMFDLTPLYTSPQALTPITADDVTDEMRNSYVSAHQNIGSPMLSEQIAAAYNAVIKNRSEAR